MRNRIPVLVIVLLAAFVISTTARIEVLNYQAGNYLPRSDRNPDGTLADGKWRASLDNTPRDQLRSAVQTFGLLQYVLAPLLLVLATLVSLQSKKSWAKVVGATSVLVAVFAAHAVPGILPEPGVVKSATTRPLMQVSARRRSGIEKL